MATEIQLKRSFTSGQIPGAANVLVGEPVLNLVDRVLYTKDNSGNIVVISSGNASTIASLAFNAANVAAAYTVAGVAGNVSNIQLASGITSSGLLTTANISELTNLYFTNARARESITIASGNVNGKGSYDSATGVISINAANVTVSSNAPTNPYVGDLWIHADTAVEYLFFGDGDTFQWVELGEPSTGSSESTITVAGVTGNVSNVQLVSGISQTGILTTANVTEVTNLYFTNARAVASLTAGQSITIDANGRINSTATGSSSTYGDSNVILLGYATNANVALKANVADLKTANVAELTNLYFTNSRVYSNVTQLGYITSASLSGYATNTQLGTYATNAQLGSYATNAQLASYATNAQLTSYATTTNVALKANVVDLTTANVTENTNQYFTNARTIAAITNTTLSNLTVSGNITLNGQPTTYGYVNGSYLFALNNADQSVGQNGAVNFQTTSASNGSLITKTSNSQITLASGNSYKLRAVIGRLQSSSTWAQFRWYDVTNSAYVGSEGFSEVVNSTGAIGSTNVPTAYVTPSVNTTYELRQTTVNTITVNAYASMEVEQINPTIAVQATATGTVATNYIATTRTGTNQTITTGGTDIVLNTTDKSSGSSVTYNTSTGVYTLTAGTTYELSFTPSWNYPSGGSSYIQYDWVDATTNTSLDSDSGSFCTAYAYTYTFASHNHNIISKLVYTPSTNQTVKIRATGTNNTGAVLTAGSSAYVKAMNAIFALNALATMATTGNVSVGGDLSVTGNVTGTNLTSKTTGSWTVTTGTNTYSITVPINGNYQIWVRANIPNGIIAYQATVGVTNTNVPVLGTQRAWNYTGGGSPILLTSMPTQIVGAEGTISTTVVSTTTANRLDFGINNTSGSSQTVYWGYVTL